MNKILNQVRNSNQDVVTQRRCSQNKEAGEKFNIWQGENKIPQLAFENCILKLAEFLTLCQKWRVFSLITLLYIFHRNGYLTVTIEIPNTVQTAQTSLNVNVT